MSVLASACRALAVVACDATTSWPADADADADAEGRSKPSSPSTSLAVADDGSTFWHEWNFAFPPSVGTNDSRPRYSSSFALSISRSARSSSYSACATLTDVSGKSLAVCRSCSLFPIAIASVVASGDEGEVDGPSVVGFLFLAPAMCD